MSLRVCSSSLACLLSSSPISSSRNGVFSRISTASVSSPAGPDTCGGAAVSAEGARVPSRPRAAAGTGLSPVPGRARRPPSRAPSPAAAAASARSPTGTESRPGPPRPPPAAASGPGRPPWPRGNGVETARDGAPSRPEDSAPAGPSLQPRAAPSFVASAAAPPPRCSAPATLPGLPATKGFLRATSTLRGAGGRQRGLPPQPGPSVGPPKKEKKPTEPGVKNQTCAFLLIQCAT